MKLKAISVLVFVSTVLAGLSPFLGAQSSAPLPSWNEGPTKSAIVKFVSDVTTQGSSSFVEPAERIAVFDNDGTLWTEQPLYNQMAFMLGSCEGARSEPSGLEDDAAVQGGPR